VLRGNLDACGRNVGKVVARLKARDDGAERCAGRSSWTSWSPRKNRTVTLPCPGEVMVSEERQRGELATKDEHVGRVRERRIVGGARRRRGGHVGRRTARGVETPGTGVGGHHHLSGLHVDVTATEHRLRGEVRRAREYLEVVALLP
jgi:hypothetical protein